MNYSIDMIRLNTYVEFKEVYFKSIENRMLQLCDSNYWQSFKVTNYRHNWNFKYYNSFTGEICSFKLNYHHNSENTNRVKKLMSLEYNPNKCSIEGILAEILYKFYKSDFIIQSLDVAIDIEIDIDNLIVDNALKRDYKEFRTTKGTTKYYGNNVKIYDKAKERGIIGKDWTRYEISLQIKEYESLIYKNYKLNELEVPKIYTHGNEDIKDETLKALFWAVKNGYPLKELSRKYKDKIKEILKDKSEIIIEVNKIKETIFTYSKDIKSTIEGLKIASELFKL